MLKIKHSKFQTKFVEAWHLEFDLGSNPCDGEGRYKLECASVCGGKEAG